MRSDDPRHGTYAGWQAHQKSDRSPCEHCRRAQHLYAKRLKYRLHADGPERTELGERAWRIIDSMGRRELGRLTGLRDSHLSRLHAHGPSTRVYRRTRDAILAARPAATPLGVQRRMQALCALGYSAATLAIEAGVTVDAMRQLIRRKSPGHFHHERVTLAAIAAYDRLSMLPMPTTRSSVATRNRAARRGYAPPLAWDNIDDPAEQPKGTKSTDRRATPLHDDYDEAVVLRILAGDKLRATPPERAEVVRRWRTSGRPLADLERLTGWKVERYREAS